MQIVCCEICNSLVEYDNTSIVEGNRDFENIDCSRCNTTLTRVFTDLVPVVRIVED